ncbi:hypothetical protein [Corynebacterium sp. AOP12-C2-36]|uniref:hypothetical protein n=1 Tax=Corynebacterium sp. AOP12-C2-36 TaxID=3457723 RepID=UPI00403341F3
MTSAKSLLGAADFTYGLTEEIRELQNELALANRDRRELESTNQRVEMRADDNAKKCRRYRNALDAHEREDAQAIELLRKARQTIGINPEGARNLIDQATTILNPPDNAPAPF